MAIGAENSGTNNASDSRAFNIKLRFSFSIFFMGFLGWFPVVAT